MEIKKNAEDEKVKLIFNNFISAKRNDGDTGTDVITDVCKNNLKITIQGEFPKRCVKKAIFLLKDTGNLPKYSIVDKLGNMDTIYSIRFTIPA